MSGGWDPFSEERMKREEQELAITSREKTYLKDLLASPAGRWLFGKIIEESGIEKSPYFHGNSRDGLDTGRRQLGFKFKNMIVNSPDFGVKAYLEIVKFNKETKHGTTQR